MRRGVPLKELASLIGGENLTRVLRDGALEEGLLSVGEVIGLLIDIPRVDELIERMIDEAKRIASNMGS